MLILEFRELHPPEPNRPVIELILNVLVTSDVREQFQRGRGIPRSMRIRTSDRSWNDAT